MTDSRKSAIKLCEHCLETCNTITAIGACAEASSQHYAMALVRQARAEGRSLFEVFEFLALISDAPELEPRRRVTDVPVPYLVSLPMHGVVLPLAPGEQIA